MVDALERFAADTSARTSRCFTSCHQAPCPTDLEGSASSRKIEESGWSEAGIPFVNFRNHAEFLRHYALFADPRPPQ